MTSLSLLLAFVLGADESDSLRRQREEMLQARVARFDVRLVENDEALKRSDAPVLRWSNPVRDFVNDGLTFMWLEGARPRAVVTCWARSTKAELNEGEVCQEFVSLSNTHLELRHRDETLWEPMSGGVVDQELAEAGEPLVSATRRLAQMRELARRFEASSHKQETASQLRLLPQPLYRFSDKGLGIVDGALFAFVDGNDPEVFLLLEASDRENRKGSAWRYTLARSTTHRVTVRLDDREVFTAALYWSGRPTVNDPDVGHRRGHLYRRIAPLAGLRQHSEERQSNNELLVPGSETLVGWQCMRVYSFRDIPPAYHAVEWIGGRRWRASHGKQCLDLDGKLGQELPTTPGEAYRVRFDVAGNPESGPRRQHLRVTIDEHAFDFEFDSRGTSTQDLGWETKEISFIAKGDKSVLAFTNLKPNKESAGVALDHVVVQQLDRPDRRPGEPVPADVTDGLRSR